MDRIRRAEHLDVLTLTDADGRVFYRSGNPRAPTESLPTTAWWRWR